MLDPTKADAFLSANLAGQRQLIERLDAQIAQLQAQRAQHVEVVAQMEACYGPEPTEPAA